MGVGVRRLFREALGHVLKPRGVGGARAPARVPQEQQQAGLELGRTPLEHLLERLQRFWGRGVEDGDDSVGVLRQSTV